MGFRLEEEAYFQNESSLETQDEDQEIQAHSLTPIKTWQQKGIMKFHLCIETTSPFSLYVHNDGRKTW